MNIQQLQDILTGKDPAANLIYNKYQRSDYSVGQDNLNPQRELSLTDAEMYADIEGMRSLTDAEMYADIEGMRAQLYMLYRERLEALRAKSSTKAGVASDLGLSYDDREEAQIPLILQETTISNGEDVSPTLDIEKMIGSLSGLLGDDVLTSGDLPFDICAGINDQFDQFDPTAYTGLSDTGATGASGSGGSGSASSGDGSGSNSQVAQDDMSCILHEIGLLEFLLRLIAFMQMIAKIQKDVLAVVFLVVRYATLIAQAWVNPTAIGELIQELANSAVTMAGEILATIIQMIWDSLNLDCLLKGSLASLRGVMGNVGAVSDLGSETESFLRLNNQAGSQLAQAGATLKDAFGSRSLRDVLTDNGELNVGESIGNGVASALQVSGAVQKINNAKVAAAQAYSSGIAATADIGSGIATELGKTTAGVAGVVDSGASTLAAGSMRSRAAALKTRADRGYDYAYDDEGHITGTVPIPRDEREGLRTTAAELESRAETVQGNSSTRAEERQQALDSYVENVANITAQAQAWSKNAGGAVAASADRAVSEGVARALESLPSYEAVDRY